MDKQMIAKLITDHPFAFSMEGISTLIIVILCIIIFNKLKEVQELSGKVSIRLFRYSFLFFGLTYVFRLVIFVLGTARLFFGFNARIFLFIFIPLIVFTSFTAISNLTCSAIKGIQEKKRIQTYILLTALTVLIISIFTASIEFLIFLEIGMFIFTLGALYSGRINKKRKSKNPNKIYLLLFLFWILSIGVFNPVISRHFSPLFVLPQIISTIIFIFIYRKVMKWIR